MLGTVQLLRSDKAARRVLFWIPPVAGLLISAAFVYTTSYPRPPIYSWGGMFYAAFSQCLGAVTVAALTAAVLHPLLASNWPLRIEQTVQRTALTALWLPPLFLLVRQGSPWSAAPALLFAICIIRLFTVRPLAQLDRPDRPPSFFASLATAAFLQAGIAFQAMEDYEFACLFLAVALAVMLARVALPDRKPLFLRRRLAPSWRVSAATALAVFLTIAGTMRFLHPGEWSFLQEGKELLALFGRGAGSAQKKGEQTRRRDPRFTSSDLSPSHPGIVLWPEVKQTVTLIAPLPALGPSLSRMGDKNPLSIPFFGAYWLYRHPDLKPPGNSLVMRGRPDRMSFRSNDGVPLEMEARQNLGMLVNLDCCREIRVEISNADSFFDTVEMELWLINTTLPKIPSFRLATVPVRSAAKWRFSGPGRLAPGIEVQETLIFPMPAERPFAQFDEIRVRYLMTNLRAEKSPRIAIERFVFVPRGA